MSYFGLSDYYAEQLEDIDLSLSGDDLKAELTHAKEIMAGFPGSAGSMYKSLELTPPLPDSLQEVNSILNMIWGLLHEGTD
jgi:hypothetical protein